MKFNYILNAYNIIEYVEYPADESKSTFEIPDGQEVYVGYSTIIDGVFCSNEDQYLKAQEAHTAIEQAIQERDNILQWFKDNDWKVNKFVLGEWLIERKEWQAYLSERKAKRARYDELTAIIG